MKLSRLTLLALLISASILLTACGRFYLVTGLVVASDAEGRPKAGIAEFPGGDLPAYGAPIPGATVELLLDCDPHGKPLRESDSWETVSSDADGRFRIEVYGPAAGELRAALRVSAPGYASQLRVYWDEEDPDEQTFLAVLEPQPELARG